MKDTAGEYDAIVLGASAGGLAAISVTLAALPAGFPAPVVVVQHRLAEAEDRLSRVLDRRCRLPVGEAGEKDSLEAGRVYVAPSAYHLLIEQDRTFSLSMDERVNHARPSIDVLFESAADAYGPRLIGVVLTGAGKDGADGLRRVAALGGAAIVQDPATAEVASMPRAALASVPDALAAPLDDIGPLLIELVGAAGAPDG